MDRAEDHPTYRCSICIFDCNTVSKYVSHCRFHRNIPNVTLRCPIPSCNQSFCNFSTFKAHISRFHSENKPLQNLGTQEIANSAPHLQQRCMKLECFQMSFTSYEDFIKHLKLHLSKKEEITCPYEGCKSTFRIKSSFSSHLSRKHRFQTFSEVSQRNASDVYRQDPAIRDDCEVSQETTEDVHTDENFDCEISDFDFNDNEKTERYFLENLALFYLKLQGKYIIPSSTIQVIISEMNECHMESQILLVERVCSTLSLLGISQEITDQVKLEMLNNDLFSNCNLGPLSTSAKRLSFYKKHFHHCNPVELVLGYGGDQSVRSYQYVPICQTIASLYQHNKEHFHFFTDERNDPSYLHDVTSGYIFKQNSFFTEQKAFAIILYQDAFEVVNPLGSAKKKHKLVGVYYTLANFSKEKRSNIDHMQLALLCKEKYLKEYSTREVFARLIHDLQLLEQDGVNVGEENIKGSIICICGDNLGSHSIGGFMESFSANYFCRYCEINRDESETIGTTLPLRSVNDYKACVSNQESTPVKGVKFDSPFNELGHYHVSSPGLPPCLGQDLFEGVVSFDMALILNFFINLRWFTIEQLNHRIKTWHYEGYDSLDRPALFVKNAEKLSGHAVQNWVFLRIFSMIMKAFIQDYEHPMWKMYLNLKFIVEIICSTRLSLSQVAVLNVYIEEYIFDRKTLFPNVCLKPKHHFLLHYPQLIIAFGPLIHLWTMRFESKHTYFKKCARQLHNFKHITKTFANKHQYLQAYYTNGSLFKSNLVLSESAFSLNKHLYNVQIQDVLLNYNISRNCSVTNKVTYKNTKYQTGQYIVIDDDEEEIILKVGKINFILFNTSIDKVVFMVSVYYFQQLPELGIYQQNTNESFVHDLVPVSILKCSVPVPVYQFNNFTRCFLSLKALSN